MNRSEKKLFPTRHTGFHPVSHLRNEIDRVFDHFSWPELGPYWRRFFRDDDGQRDAFYFAAAVDISEGSKGYEIKAELPGVSEDNIDIKVVDNRLVVSAEKRDEREEQDKQFHLTERSFGRFQRSFDIPSSVDPNNISAKFKKGILTVSLPKSKEAATQQRKIEVRGE